MLSLTSVATLSEIAEENFNVLYCLSSCGFAAGIVILPLLAAMLIGPYGWRGGFLVLGAIMGNIIPCVCSFAVHVHPTNDPPSTHDSKRAVTTQSGRASEDHETDQTIGCKGAGNQQEDEVTCLVDEDDMESTSRREISAPLSLNSTKDMKETELSPDCQPHTPLLSQDDLSSVQDDNDSRSIFAKIANFVRESDLYNDPFYTFVMLSSSFHAVTYTGWHGFLIPHALQRGISLNHTIVITLCASVGSLTGRFLSAFLSHRLINPIDIYLTLTSVNVSLLLCYALVRNFYAMLILSFMSACAISGRTVMPTLAVRGRGSPKHFPILLGFLDVSRGLGNFTGGYLSGTSLCSYNLHVCK